MFKTSTHCRALLQKAYCLTIICVCLLVAQAQATVRRVRAGNTTPGNGSTWAAAYSNLQLAIDASGSGDEVWVAVPVGVAKYQPANGISYVMGVNGVKIYGGFAGSETALANRNWRINVTTLQGNNNSVVRCADALTSSAELNGFTITGGKSPDVGFNTSKGGGINCNGASTTFTNLIIADNQAIFGAGFYCSSGSPTLTNVVFTNNSARNIDFNAGYGGGMYNSYSNPTVSNVVFYNNNASTDGGAIYTLSVDNTKKPVVTNTLFVFNQAAYSGGAVFGSNTSYIFTNCTFAQNRAYQNPSGPAGSGGALHNYITSSSVTSTSQVKNCLFFLNQNYTNAFSDIINKPGATTNTTYSMLTPPPATGGNVALSGGNPFVNTGDADGPDNIWMTADDGYRLANCNPLVIDKGDNAGVPLLDITGQPRRIDMPIATDGGSGTAPIVDMGAYENQNANVMGSIGNAHVVPLPQELTTDTITNVLSPAAGMTVKWQKNVNGGGWVDTPLVSSLYYIVPMFTSASTTQFRRVVQSAEFCDIPYYSNIVIIKAVYPNGNIFGKVLSQNFTPVKGITITAQRLGPAIGGSPANFTYTTITGDNGTYNFDSKIYYGDPTPGSNNSASFRVTPSKAEHVFDFPYLDQSLTTNTPQPPTGVDFIDKTVFSLTGRTFQQCTNCNNTNGVTEIQTCPLDGVEIWKDNQYYSTTGFIDTAYGRYAVSITDPGTVRIEPRYNNHLFSPVFRNVPVTDNVSGLDFRDTTTHTIEGRLTDGCNSFIGNATLEFTDIIPNDANGNPRSSCFRKRVTTFSGSGNYIITLPARKYSVRVVSFASNVAQGNDAYIFDTDLMPFFNTRLPKDSLTRDITTRDTVLNLKFIREPTLKIMSGLDTLCNGTNRGYAFFQQGIVDSFTVKAFQGPASIGCAVTDTTNKIRVFTSIPSNDNTNQQRNFNPADTGVTVRMLGGTPFIIAPYYKTLNIQYTDVYSRSTASLSKNVVVTGVKADVATFTTVSPQIPMMILHDPPGSLSSSYRQSNKTVQNAFRMYSKKGLGRTAWTELKIGAKFEAGLGVSVESAVWGTINNEVTVNSTNTSGNETILSTTTSTSVSTSSSPSVTGANGDVYIGAALNLIYAGATEIKRDACGVSNSRTMIIASDGFSTQYHYTEGHIKNTIIPTLTALAQNPGTTQAKKDSFMNQVNVWQQVLDNNAANKARATFGENISFSYGTVINNQITSSLTNTNTVEFSMEIDANLAAELGFEYGGSGGGAGLKVNVKTEFGTSTTNATIQETTTGYTLQDDDIGDYFSVNVKKDPVYSTPVFELAAGTASCPPEENAQPRDEPNLTVAVPAISNIPENAQALFTLVLGNTSQSHETRTYLLSFDQSSNPNGAMVTIGGSPVLTPIPYTIGDTGRVQVTVAVSKPAASQVFSFEGLKFNLTDACTGEISTSAIISAYFVNQCSNITLAAPENGWTLNSAANNLLPILIKDYNINGLTSVALEYSRSGTSNWVTGFTRDTSQGQLNSNGANGTLVNWNISGLADTTYNLRLKLNCSQGVVYSQRATGLIDRKAPTLFGNPTPTDDVYVNGDVISFSYNEKLTSNLDSIQVTMRRLSNNALIPVTLSSFENKIVIVPNSSIAGFTGDSIRVIINRVADQYGNVKTTPDTTRFIIGVSTASTGTNALITAIATPVVYKNSDSAIKVFFRLPVNATHDTRVNYTIGGTARLGIDYTIEYTTSQPGYAFFNGSQGSTRIENGSNQTQLLIRPIKGDTSLSPDKTIIISLSEGGDYALGATTSVVGRISSEDGIMIYTFTGDGNFNVKSNWLDGKMPLTTLAPGKEIIIDPSGVCNLNVPLTIKPAARLTVKQNKQFIIKGSLRQQ